MHNTSTFCRHGCTTVDFDWLDTYTYGETGYLICLVHQEWDSDTSLWISVDSTFYRVDPAGDLAGKVHFTRDPDPEDWMPADSRAYRQDSVRDEQIHYFWNAELRHWIKDMSDLNAYDSEGNLTGQISFDWQPDNSDWMESDRQFSAYDVDGRLLEERYYYREPEFAVWIPEGQFSAYWSSINYRVQTYRVDENCGDCIITGSLLDGMNYPLKNMTFEITAKDSSNILILDSQTGDFTINANDLDYETKSLYIFDIKVTGEDSTGTVEKLTGIILIVDNVNDHPPAIIIDNPFEVAENSEPGTYFGQVGAVDEDGILDPISYSILSGNQDNAFEIDSASGMIAVHTDSLDYEVQPMYELTIGASDGIYTGEAVAVIFVDNRNDIPPTVQDTTFYVDENSGGGTSVGTLSATDGDGGLNSLFFTPFASDGQDYFSIVFNTGEIKVRPGVLLDYETKSSYDFKVGVYDGRYTTESTVGIKINELIETSTHYDPSDSRIHIFQNPFSDLRTVLFPDAGAARKIELIDMYGRTLRIYDRLNSNSLTMYRENLPPGL